MSGGKPIGVIGGSLGAACTLAARGHAVTLFEKNEWLGGKAAVLEADGYRCDMAPTILTMPRLLARIFQEAGTALEDEVPLIRLDPQWRCFFEGGGMLDLDQGVDSTAGQARSLRRRRGRCRLSQIHPPGRASARRVRALLLLEVGRGSG